MKYQVSSENCKTTRHLLNRVNCMQKKSTKLNRSKLEEKSKSLCPAIHTVNVCSSLMMQCSAVQNLIVQEHTPLLIVIVGSFINLTTGLLGKEADLCMLFNSNALAFVFGENRKKIDDFESCSFFEESINRLWRLYYQLGLLRTERKRKRKRAGGEEARRET